MITYENNKDPKKHWNTINKILHKKYEIILPDTPNIAELAQRFSDFFRDKIETIRATFSGNCYKLIKPSSEAPELSSFDLVSEQHIEKLITTSANKSCSLDPIPTFILKDCLDVLLTPITCLINYSLQEGAVPDDFKLAHVTPLLKKATLDKNMQNDYRPVSNLSFVSKLVEKVVAEQLKSHLNQNALANNDQSAYRKFHSTETALLKISNDLHSTMDKKEVAALTLLDLSAAFDTIDHSTLFDTLTNWFNIQGSVVNWLKSYLTNRQQQIKLGKISSNPSALPYGVPQGSVLGPLLFTMYTEALH